MRFDPPSGKEFRPCALWRSETNGRLEWRWASWPAPRPLYGLDRLAARPSAPVLICEGEKASDAAGRLVPDYVSIASPNGSKSAGKADWSPLRDREVTIWRDADMAGAAYSEEVARLASEAGARSVAIIEPPGGVEDGWDAADAEAGGWATADVNALIAAARTVATPDQQLRATRTKRRERKSADSKEDGARRKRGVESVIELIDGRDCTFWHSPDQTAYVSVKVNGHRENYKVNSREFGRYITLAAYQGGVAPPTKSTIDDALRLFEARAISDGPQRKPWLRVGEAEGCWLIDLGDPAWRVVKITPGKWTIEADHDYPMLRSAAMLPLPEPAYSAGADGLELLEKFVNADYDGFRLIIAWLLAAMRAKGPFPILILNGEQGSAKSTLSRLLRSLIDPNIAPVRAMPKDDTDLIVAARNGHLIAIDNVSGISSEMSDALCRITTGGGFSSRVKFTDADEFVVYVKNPVLLNGIPEFVNRPDLASRSIVVRLNPIKDEDRKAEEQHEAEWMAAAPHVLGALLNVIASALANFPDVKLSGASRMADFERLIEAASPALAWEPGEFAAIYRANRDELDASAIEADPVASAIISFVHDEYPQGWAGTATRLLEALGSRVSDAIKKTRSWPGTASALSGRLERAKPLLRRHGITVARKHSGDRMITLMVGEGS
jgi:putative DNA primase/helicase